MKRYNKNLKIYLTLILFLFSFFFFLFSCKNSTSPSTVTLSGTVTLEDTTDYSGVKVMIFEPVEIDTALTNLNQLYPEVGVAFNQESEFFWREHTPIRKTLTSADGSWKIEDVPEGIYHIVMEKEGYGWKILWNENGRSPIDFRLKKAITWQGNVNGPIIVPENSFVRVKKSTTILGDLTILQGTVIEFQNEQAGRSNIDLAVNGNLQVLGTKGERVFIFADDTMNSNDIKLENQDKVQIEYMVTHGQQNGFYLKAIPYISFNNNRFHKMRVGLNAFDCDSVVLTKNCFSNFMQSAIKTSNAHLKMEWSLVYDCGEMGLESKNANNSSIKYCIFKGCNMYAISFNLGGYGYDNSYAEMSYVDFLNNKNAVYTGFNILGNFNKNNFISSEEFHVKTLPFLSYYELNFKENFWNTINIEEKIFDIKDINDPIYVGPIVNFDNFKNEKIEWVL